MPMELIRENLEKQRKVFFCGDRYRKEWYNTTPEWIVNHVAVLDKVMPWYVLAHGDNWIEFAILPGTLASKIEHTDGFVKKIWDYCQAQIAQTKPYYHGDWVLSNIIVDGDTMYMCDWDNIGQYSEQEVQDKLRSDLISAFGLDRFKREIDDSTSI